MVRSLLLPFALLSLGQAARAADPPPVEVAQVAEGSPPPTEAAVPAPTAAADHVDRKKKAKAAGAAFVNAFKFYGILKPTVAVSSGAAESYGRPNLTAITAAGNPVLNVDPDHAEYTFQIGQSRVGVKINDGQPVRGQIEIDFVDFDKASPTVASLPRLRLAQLEWDPAKNHTIFAGQGWDLFLPLMPHHFDLVGATFQSGNVGFMRQQIQYRYHPDKFEIGVAVGMPGVNTSSGVGTVELGPMPSLTAKVGFSPSEHFMFSMHGFASMTGAKPEDHLLTWAAGIDTEVKLKGGFNLRAEGYIGQNTANSGMLGISQGRPGTDVRDAGGWLSIKQPIGAHFSPYLTIGGAGVLNPDDVAIAYTPATDTAAAARNTTAGPGIRWNTTGRLGAELPILHGLSLQVEGFALVTRHQLAAAEAALFDPTRVAGGVEGGAIYRF